jgi:hypothetical protein
VSRAGLLAALFLFALPARAAPKLVAGPDFTVPLPDGYANLSQRSHKPSFIMLEASHPSRGYQPTIVFRQTPIAGGSLGDPATCAQTGRSLATGVHGKLDRASIISGPLGKTCQIRLVAPQGVAFTPS